MEFLYLAASDGEARSLLGISCAIQIITGMGLLISEQDAVHQGNQSYITRKSEQNSNPSGSNGGLGGAHMHQSQYASAQTTRSWLPSSLHPRSAEVTTSTFNEQETGSYKQPTFHGITLSVHQHCSDATDVMDVERGYPNLSGKNDHSSDDISPAAAGWTSTPLSTQTPSVEPLFFLPQHNQDLETRPVTYPKLGLEPNPKFSPSKGKMATEDVTLLTKMTDASASDEGEETSMHTRAVHSSSQKRKHGGDNLSISSIRAQAQLRKIEAYRNLEDMSYPTQWAVPFTGSVPQQSLSPKTYNVKRKSVPSIVPERNDSGSADGPSLFEARLSDKPMPPAYSATEDQQFHGQLSGREPKLSMSSPPNTAKTLPRVSNDEDLMMSATTGTFGGRFSATSIKGASIQRSSNASASRSQFTPLGLALPAMVHQKNVEREVQSNDKPEQKATELPTYNLPSNQPSIRRIQGSTHNRSFSEGPYRGSMRSNPFFGPAN